MSANIAEKAGFLYEGKVPFALASCEKFKVQPVTGRYDEVKQVWQGHKDVAAATLTLTATPGDNDNDRD